MAPHPDRVFMALVDAWGVSGRTASGADALRWLECQEPPEIAAPEASPRSGFRNFVPTSSNGAQGLAYLGGPNILQIVQSIVRKERTFPAVVLPDDSPSVHMIWRDASPDAGVLDSLKALACTVSHVGHSASLTRVSVAAESDAEPTHVASGSGTAGGLLLRCPCPGRFEALVSGFAGTASAMAPSWPSPAPTRRYDRPPGKVSDSTMGPAEEWIVLSAAAGLVPALRAFPVVAKAMRDAIISHVQGDVHEVISGRTASGCPLGAPHLAILPMANVGWGRHSDGGLLGLALVLPRGSAYGTAERRQLRQAVSRFLDPQHGGGHLHLGRSGAMSLKLDAVGAKKSLIPDRYTGVDRTWVSATPVVLDKHPKKRQSAESIVAEGCVRTGLPRPASVAISRHSSVPGSPPALVGRSTRAGWRPPKPGMLDNRLVYHAALRFEVDVRGPVIAGAGRYYGMGLFLPTGAIAA